MKRTLSLATAVALVACTALSVAQVAQAKPKGNGKISIGSSNLVIKREAPKVLFNHQPTIAKLQTPKVFKQINGNHFRTANTLLLNRGTIRTLTPKVVVKDYHLKCGTKHACGICYKTYTHNHWAHCCYLPACGCECYYCPCTLVYYYWCVPDGCWYPISYCPYGTYVF
jgi:hypothetical protein